LLATSFQSAAAFKAAADFFYALLKSKVLPQPMAEIVPA
jgi:hypothetical protein